MGKRVKILLQIFAVVVMFVGMVLGVGIIRSPKEIVVERAATVPTINDFKTSYNTMLSRYLDSKRIQLFGGGLTLAEFDDANNKVYAGHLGNFWSPPFFSSHSANAENNSADYINAFNHGLVFYNVGYGGGAAESPTDISSEVADWYPSKIVMEHHYPGGGGGTLVRGVKVALPETRGFGLKVTMTNQTSTTQSQKLLFLGWLPTFDKKASWTPPETGWNWWQGHSVIAKTKSSYESSSSDDLILISNTSNSSYMAVGLSEKSDSWGTDVGNYDMYTYFLNQGAGSLLEQNKDTSTNDGSAFGLVADFSNLSPSQSKTVTMIIGVGSTSTDAKKIVTDNRGKNIEAESDNYWNSRISQAFSNLPTLVSGDSNLNAIYENAILSYLVNRWEIFSSSGDLGQTAGFGQSTSLFPWFWGTTGVLPMIDSTFWRAQLNKLMNLDYANCRADEVVAGIDLCDVTYAYNPYSLLQAVYDYVALSGDYAFLTSTNYDKLNNLIKADDNREDGDGLVDFGNDSNLYEFNRRNCDLAGKYTGKVISPNAERIVAHRQLAELAEKTGKSQSEVNYHVNKASAIKSSIQVLWNSSAETFDSINSKRVTFKTIFPYLLFQHDDIITSNQIGKLKSNIGDFEGEYGLTSLPTDSFSSKCVDADWHGPGLYSGAVGAVVEGFFRQGYTAKAYSLLSKYNYLANMPYFSQAMPHDSTEYRLAPAYMEGVALAQTIIRGMFGVYPNTDHTRIAPRIPSSLGSASLNGLISQGHSWDINVASLTNHNLTLRVNAVSSPGDKVDHFRLGYEMNGTLNLTIHNLLASKSFAINATPVGSGSTITVYASSNSSGKLTTSIVLNGDYLIKGALGTPPATKTPTPKSTNTPTPRNTSTPTPRNSSTPTPTSMYTGTPTPTSSPGSGQCGDTCVSDGDCEAGLYCPSAVNVCRHPDCRFDTECSCVNATSTPTQSLTSTPTQVATSTPTNVPTNTITPTDMANQGDADGDDDVDMDDYFIWLSEYGGNQPQPIYDPDFNNDGKVDGEDYVIWLNNYGT